MRLATLALYSTMTLRLSTPSSTLDPAWMCTEEVGLVSAEGSRTPARVWGRWTVASGDLPSACGSGFDFAVCACSRCIFAGLTRGCDCGLRSASLCFDRWCLRRMVHVPYAAHITNEEVRRRTGQPPVTSVIAKRRLRLFGHLARADPSQDHSRILRAAINRPPADWRRRAGRPRRTWLRTIDLDLRPHNLGLNTAWMCAQDRSK